jgi:hypothetical protein
MEHVDLFFYRDTTQSNIHTLMFKSDKTLNDFGHRLVTLAERLICLSRPIIILVSNAFAATIFKSQFNLNEVELDYNGLYWVDLEGQETPVPVLLSGMIGGQRALDVHSRERLVWHMKRTLKMNQRNQRGHAACTESN